MAKLGLPRHRYTVATLCWLYVVIALLMQLYCIFNTFYGSIFVISCIHLLIGCFGLYSLYKENTTLMKNYGIITAVIVVLQLLNLIVLLIIIIVSVFRNTIVDTFLKELMDKYYENESDRNLMDRIQLQLQCCGRQSYTDWTITPFSCCKSAGFQNHCLAYHADGCGEVLGPIVSNIILVFGLVCIVSTILHICAVFSAFDLARVYRRIPILPSIKHSFSNL